MALFHTLVLPIALQRSLVIPYHPQCSLTLPNTSYHSPKLLPNAFYVKLMLSNTS